MTPDGSDDENDPDPPRDASDGEDDPFEQVETDLTPEIEDEADGASEAIVPKNRYCESCEYFDAPPAVRCTHPGTEIRELVDMEHFRVFDCPVVADRREMAEVVSAEADAAIDDVADEG